MYQIADRATANGQVVGAEANRRFAEGEGDVRHFVGHVQRAVHDVHHHTRRAGVDAVALGVGGAGAVACRIGGGHFGVDHFVAIGGQLGTGYLDAEGVARLNQSGVGLAVDAQGDGVADLDVAAHGTGDGDVLFGLGRVEHVVGGDVGVQGDAGHRRDGVGCTAILPRFAGVTCWVSNDCPNCQHARFGYIFSWNHHDDAIADIVCGQYLGVIGLPVAIGVNIQSISRLSIVGGHDFNGYACCDFGLVEIFVSAIQNLHHWRRGRCGIRLNGVI